MDRVERSLAIAHRLQTYVQLASHIGALTASALPVWTSDYGCPLSLPYRCEFSGICMPDSYHCYTVQEMFSHLSLLPPTSSAGLCSRLQKIPCYSKNGLFYCAKNADECYSQTNGCPVNKPILCNNGLCVNSADYCSITSL
jgi:hypothetical protein